MQYYIYFAVLFVLIFSFIQTGMGQVVGWDFAGKSGNEESVEATTISPYLHPSTITRGNGISTNSLNNSFNSSSFSRDTSFTTAIENDEYIEFTLQALQGFTVSLSTLDSRFRRSSTGPYKFLWQYSLDGFATEGIAIGDTITYEGTSGDGNDQEQIDLSGINDLQNVESETVITIRLYAWGASAASGTFAIGRRSGNDLVIDGTIEMPPGPVITHIPLQDTELTSSRTVEATLTGEGLVIDGDNRPVLWYRVNETSWTNTFYDNRTNDDFSFIIPSQDENSVIEYYIAAKDADGVTTHPFGGSGDNPPGSTPPETFHSYTILQTTPDIDGFAFYFTTDPENVSEENRIVYPHVGMGKEVGEIQRFGDDWTYIDPEFTFYLVLQGDNELIAAEFYVNWDHTFGEVDIELGTLFPDADSNQFTEEIDDGRVRVNAASLNGNVRPEPGDYLATISIKALSPGHMDMFIDGIKLRYYDEVNDEQIEIPAESYPGEIKFYLGDFGRDDNNNIATDRGDGVIDFNDLMLFASAYWSKRGEDDAYRTKFDIGPTNDGGGYFAMPSPDGDIDFEDLVVFAIGYYKSTEGELTKNAVEPLRIIVHEAREEGNTVIIPVGFEGNVADVRAISLDIDITEAGLTFKQATPAGELDRELGFLAASEIHGNIQLDAAIIRSAFAREEVFVHLHFEKSDDLIPWSLGSVSAIARNSYNIDIPLEISVAGAENAQQTPVSFSLSQNYPNPFNPVTTIEYQLPEKTQVNIVIYNVLGEQVAELMNGIQQRGHHSVTWDGLFADNKPAPSGLYIYRMKAGDYVETKRMILLK